MDTLKIKNNSGMFCLYNSFVDRYIKDANASFIKVYIYIARHCCDSCEISLDSISENTGLLKSDVVSAVKYWDKVGAISLRDNEITILNPDASSNAPQIDTNPEKANVTSPQPEKILMSDRSAASAYKASNVIKTVTSDEKLANLFAIIAQLLNKTLSPNDYKIIYSFIDYLKMPDQVIIFLIEHCASISKTSMRYIEKVAYSWADNGINTPEAAIEYIQKANSRASVLNHYKKCFKISGRDFAPAEEQYILTWINELKADESLIMNAYESSVMNTGKIAFKYMDAIIRNELAGNGNTNSQPLSSNIRKSTFRNYPDDNSIGDIEKQMIEKMMMQYGGDDDAVNE